MHRIGNVLSPFSSEVTSVDEFQEAWIVLGQCFTNGLQQGVPGAWGSGRAKQCATDRVRFKSMWRSNAA